MTSKMKVASCALAALLTCTIAAQSQTVTSFRWWNTTVGSLTDSSGAGIAAGQATVLTFLTSDSTANPETVMNIANPGSWGSWAAVATAVGAPVYVRGNRFDDRFGVELMTESFPTDFAVGQYAWAIILDMPVASFTTLADVPIGTYFNVHGDVVSPQINNLNTTPPLTAQSFGGFSVQTLHQIPEPGDRKSVV